jgi:hypothetical protein
MSAERHRALPAPADEIEALLLALAIAVFRATQKTKGILLETA